MKQLKTTIQISMRGLSLAVIRFPLTVLGLITAAVLIIRLIATDGSQELLLQKIILTVAVGSVLGVAAQFAVERFQLLLNQRLITYVVVGLLMLGFFLVLRPAPELNERMLVQSFVAMFAMLCIGLWIPTKGFVVDFNKVALVHVKSVATSFVYTVVLSLGIAAIIGAVDLLLFNFSIKWYAYFMTVIWVIFAPIYYLSLLPRFHDNDEEELRKLEHISSYPKFLEILISNIAIPLLCAYTLVLYAYFLKILITFTWPSGQIGPMVLIYSIVGLIIFVLASLLENKFALFYRRFFPLILIPIVVMQLVSIGIRINSYGITASRYYILMFAIFSFFAGIMLIVKKIFHNGHLVLFAAVLGVISIIPPVDAFTISRISQISRLEGILNREGMLSNESLTKKENVKQSNKAEITSILYYLDRDGDLSYLKWLPEKFEIYEDMKDVFGFEPSNSYWFEENHYVSMFLNTQLPLPIQGYDILLTAFTSKDMGGSGTNLDEFEVDGKTYRLKVTNNQDTRISIEDNEGKEVIGISLAEFVQQLIHSEYEKKGLLTPDELSLRVELNGYQLKVIIQNINYITGNETGEGFDCAMYVLFAIPK